MAAPELLQYISQSKAAGFTEAQIQTALRTAGWAEEAITEAFSGTTAITPSPSPAATAPNAPANTEAELARIQSELEEAKKKFHPHADPVEQKARGIIGFLIRHHIVQTEAQANVVMLAVSALCIGTSLWLVWPKSRPAAQAPATNLGAASGTQKQ